MVQEYVNKLIENLPDEIKNRKTPLVIDLVLDGGVFNGSYLVGALCFLKEMEKRKYIKVDRISGCSVGSIIGFLYFIDKLEFMPQLYNVVICDFKKCYNLKIIKTLKNILTDFVPEDICERVNKRFFICYNNAIKRKKIVKSTYKNVDEIFNSIIKSCFIPYLIDGNYLYKNKYIDGLNPYIFNKEHNKKILYLDLLGYDKIFNLINIKNEKTNYHRILSGLLDIHCFFIKNSSTQMCSYVNDWGYSNVISNYIKLVIEKFFLYVVYIFILIKNNISKEQKETFLFKIISRISQDLFVLLLETYCL
jgi:hypothetical protein